MQTPIVATSSFTLLLLPLSSRMYHDKLAYFKKQLEDLDNGVHVEFMRRVRKLEVQYNERLRLNEVYREYLVECVERDYIFEKRSAAKEFDEKKADLKDNLLTDFEDRRKLIETERQSMELTSDSAEIKPTVTRKLRRRPNEPLPVVEKRRKPTNGTLVLMLDDKDVENDLKSINRAKGVMTVRPMASSSSSSTTSVNGGGGGASSPSVLSGGCGGPGGSSSAASAAAVAAAAASAAAAALCMSPLSNDLLSSQSIETKIEDGKLLYERRWFHRGQPVFVEGKDMPRFPGIISAINDVVWVKKLTDNGKVKINTSQLSRGKISIKRRAS